jgi:hypothetical protein
MISPIDSAINLLKKRKVEASRVDPSTTTQGLLSKFNNNLIGALADISDAFLKHTGKTEITNQPKVSVSNFPKVERLDLSPVVKAIKEIPTSKETDILPVVKAIKEIPTTKPTDISPILKAINNLPIPEPVNFGPVVKAIQDIPEPKKFPEEFKVKNQIALDKVESLLSKAVKALETAPEVKDDKLLIKELRSLFSGLTEALNESRVDAVRVLNPGDFPVAPAHAAYKKSDGTLGYGLVSTEGYVQSEIIEQIPTDPSNYNPAIHVDYDGLGNPTAFIETLGARSFSSSVTYDGSGYLTDLSAWVEI